MDNMNIYHQILFYDVFSYSIYLVLWYLNYIVPNLFYIESVPNAPIIPNVLIALFLIDNISCNIFYDIQINAIYLCFSVKLLVIIVSNICLD